MKKKSNISKHGNVEKSKERKDRESLSGGIKW